MAHLEERRLLELLGVTVLAARLGDTAARARWALTR